MSFRALAVAAALLVVGPHGVSAQTMVGGSIDVAGRSVPLPQGKWQVVASEQGRSTKHNELSRVMLAELDKGVLSRWIYISTNVDYNKSGWKRNKEICDRQNSHFGYSDSWHNENQAECWIVNHWGMTMGKHPNQAIIDFYRWSDQLGRPNTAVGVAYFFVNKGDTLTVELKYNPVIDGFPETPTGEWRGSPWHPDIASKDAKRLDYLRALKAMGEKYFQQLRTVLP